MNYNLLVEDDELISSHEHKKQKLYEEEYGSSSDKRKGGKKRAQYISLDTIIKVVKLTKQHTNWSLNSSIKKIAFKNGRSFKMMEEDTINRGTTRNVRIFLFLIN